MPTKIEMYAQLAEQTSLQLTKSWQEWTSFLTTAARLYKYPYHEQLMIYAQRPDATACAEYTLWNQRMNRYVKRGSTGIALIDTNGERPKLRYVFDISDTGTRKNSLPVNLWQMQQEHLESVQNMLEKVYGVSSHDSFETQVNEISYLIAHEYWEEHREGILYDLKESLLEQHDELNLKLHFIKAATISVQYSILSRCSRNPERFFEHEDFLPIFDFDTFQSISSLGTAVNESSSQILREIEAVIKQYEKNKEKERKQNNGKSDIPTGRGLSDPKYRIEAGRKPSFDQIRNDEENLSEGASSRPLQSPDFERGAIPPPVGDSGYLPKTSGGNDASASQRSGSNRGAESQRPDEMGWTDEQLQSTSRRDPDDRTDLQLSLFSSEEEQIQIIDEAENMKISSAFSFSQNDIDQVLRYGGNNDHQRERIVSEFSKQRSVAENAAYLQSVFYGGNGIITNSGNITAWYAEDGIRLSRTKSARYDNSAQVISWESAAKRISQLLEDGSFATNVELTEAPGYEHLQLAEKLWHLRHDLSEDAQKEFLLSLNEKSASTFPVQTEWLTQKLSDPIFRAKLSDEYKNFLKAYPINRDILRFHYHHIQDISAALADLELPRKTFETNMAELPSAQFFITEDEIDTALSYGSGIEGGKERIYTFYQQTHTTKEKADFLKNEYGIGGHTHAFSHASGSNEWHDGKGVTYKKNNCPDVKFTWEKVAGRITDLIRKDRYFTTEEKKSYEKIQVKENPNEASDIQHIHNEFVEQPASATKTKPIPEVPMVNFQITDDHIGEGGAKQKFTQNIEAIQTLFQLEAENRNATYEEQKILSNYVGWGGLADAFDLNKDNWKQEYTTLKNLLSEDEYAAARASTLNAHYTSPTVIKAIYEAVGNMGFETGNILEPSCGVGNFFGMLPEQMQNSRLYGVELDSISGRIAQKLYPKADITVSGFETTDRRDFYDLAVGNVPFGNYKVSDKPYDKLGFSIHNYFFAKALDQVRPGGVIAFVTSRFTMDSKNSDARRYLAQRAELLGAIRLPNDAFKKNAGAEVVSDIIFLQKREHPIDIVPDWVHLNTTQDGYTMNSYFADHPEMIMGTLAKESTPYGKDDITVLPREDMELSEQLKEAISHIQGSYKTAEIPAADDLNIQQETIPAYPDVKNFSYTVVDGEIYFRENSIMRHVDLNEKAKERGKGMVELRQIVNELIEYQLEDFPDEEIKQKQSQLNSAYDSFVAKNGLINSRANSQAFAEDSSYYLLCSLENIDEDGNLKSKADMFTKRTIKPAHKVTKVDTPSEALAISIGERGKVDLPYMANLLGTPNEFHTIISELKGVIFKDPTSPENIEAGWQTADEYLSGDVRSKLRIAQNAANINPDFAVNVSALEKAQPQDLDASEIDVRLGATWIDPEYIQQFMQETFETPYYLRHAIKIKFSEVSAEWRITGKSSPNYNDVAAYVTYGTERANAYRILEETLNLKDIRIYDTVEEPDGKQKRVLNNKETTLAQQKQQAIKDAFRDWIWKDPNRREKLVSLYNELFNSTRPREYDGSHITFVGMNSEITLREHQKNAIAHVLYGGNTLLAHEVGAGKTFEMAASAMESKRLGLCQKSLFVVPNHLTLQWANEFLHLYPSAKLLVATKKDFETANRKKFCARIATGDYDAVIIGHSQFEKIPLSPERQEKQLREQIDEIEDALAELKYQRGENFSIKQMEKTRKSLQARLDKLSAADRKDDVITFEQLGVDRLFVDESHAFKNLFLYTKMRNVAGLSTSEAQKSSDMFMKCRYMDELTGGRGIIFATGTPVSNSMTELYTVMRYLQYDTLKEKKMLHFDCWASTFGETTTAIELAPEGTGYRARTRFAKFFNLPELMNIFKEVADIKTSDQLNLPVPNAKFETVVVQPSAYQKDMVAELSERAAAVHAGIIDPSKDNMLKITSDGRKLGLDQRLMNPLLPDDPNSKLNACVRTVLRIWEDGKSDKLTQLVFCDLSTPKNDGTFNVYDDIKTKLIAHGVPEKEVAFIHDADTEAKKKELFAKVRTGQVRILLGSTQKMGAGTNVQDKLIAIHHLDVGWRPSDMTQRNGRIIRQGNQNKEVQIYLYVTEGTFDAYSYQTLEIKQKFISQIMTSKSPVRSCDDIDEQALSYAEIKALCAGNPLIKEKMDLDIDVARLKVLKADYQSKLYKLEDKLLKYFPAEIEKQNSYIHGFTTDIQTAVSHPQISEGFCGIEIKGNYYSEKTDAGEAILAVCKEMKDSKPVPLGTYRSFDMNLIFDSFNQEFQILLKGAMTHCVTLGTDVRGNLIRLDNSLTGISERLKKSKEQLANLYNQQKAAKAEVEKPFPQENELREKTARQVELNYLLDLNSAKTDIENEEHLSTDDMYISEPEEDEEMEM